MADAKTPKVEDIAPGWESSADVAKRLDTEPIDDSTYPLGSQPGSLKDPDKESDGSLGGPDDEPVRTNRPDGRIVQRLAKGAGQHRPLDDPEFGPDGRLRPDRILEASRKPSE